MATTKQAARKIAELSGVHERIVLNIARHLGENRVITRIRKGPAPLELSSREISYIVLGLLHSGLAFETVSGIGQRIRKLGQLNRDSEVLLKKANLVIAKKGNFIGLLDFAFRQNKKPEIAEQWENAVRGIGLASRGQIVVGFIEFYPRTQIISGLTTKESLDSPKHVWWGDRFAWRNTDGLYSESMIDYKIIKGISQVI